MPTMETCWGSRGIGAFILNLGVGGGALSASWYRLSLNRNLAGPQSQSGHYKKKKSCPCFKSNPVSSIAYRSHTNCHVDPFAEEIVFENEVASAFSVYRPYSRPNRENLDSYLHHCFPCVLLGVFLLFRIRMIGGLLRTWY